MLTKMNGAEIKEFRRRYNLTQEELAKIVESSLRAVQSWEQNNRNISKSALKLLELYSGEMLKSEHPKEEVVAKPNENEFLSYLKKQVEELKAENDNLKMENNRLREENGYYKGLLETNSIQYKQTAS